MLTYMTTIDGKRHWLDYHFLSGLWLPFTEKLMEALATCEELRPGLGQELMTNLARVPYTKDDDAKPARFQELIQVLAEVMVLRVLLTAAWPSGATFTYEPANPKGKRPELLVEADGCRFLFEVKCPSLLQHQTAKEQASVQLVARSDPSQGRWANATREQLVLPRDNPIKDFLCSADEKFEGLRRDGDFAALVIVWDECLYEVVSPLMNLGCGLLTPQTFYRTSADEPIVYRNVDGVLALSGFNTIAHGLQGRTGLMKPNPFDCTKDDTQPTIWCPASPYGRMPELLYDRFEALDYHEDLPCDLTALDSIMFPFRTGD